MYDGTSGPRGPIDKDAIRLQPQSRCKDIGKLGATLDAWEDLVRQCATGGGEFVLNNHQKQMALIQLVPEEIELIYETDTKYGTYEAKLEYARWRSMNTQTNRISETP